MTGDQQANRARTLLAHHLTILYQAAVIEQPDAVDLLEITDLTIAAAVARAEASCREPGEYRVFDSAGKYIAAVAAVFRLKFVAESLAESSDLGTFPVEHRGRTVGGIRVQGDGTWEIEGKELKSAIIRAVGPGPGRDS